MYNFNLNESEKVIEIFDDIWIKQNDNEKYTTIMLTDQRLLFLEYVKDELSETLNISRGISYVKCKEVYYQINLKEIIKVEEKENYIIVYNNKILEFNDAELYNLLRKENI